MANNAFQPTPTTARLKASVLGADFGQRRDWAAYKGPSAQA
jgi:hypothetical protein